ncbi:MULTISPECIES: phosphate ABC transporter permease subunit PstC [Rathayibacter]|jgi:phosphate transport system permease protein|uniref:phosphate ABC transporter permease subunit PstC n=1 Tax=Rathayibacter TaxID=33886 RepID=UPI000F4AAA5B|nr:MULTISPECIES: phosphate ABC transporter permease subunit PstC [Rathayibacter]MCJ1672545.1 phosphate ABC transporter permease subunit PstC [Rathayibacter sp. VKM Ac-2929]MCJ1682023.1 phosphate ABC transporter permease subunit PstC [Rathayibacter sp. VKM Ac-2928]MCJ1686032.1 phosphate ABC transporter permease subunit PstC [Rathayibacter sp. VKM Ac-2927]MCJ1699281.1 phosphate ABC transporter permease subunit PstC [Rathayibacter festucae]MCJ1705591.1 phosphate ABC transporter permease subunit P
MTTAERPVGAIKAKQRPADRIFSGTAVASGALILVILAAVALFLVVQSIPALTASPDTISGGAGFWSYVGPLVFGTVYAAGLAMVIAVPIAIGIALFISHYAPRKLAQGLGYVIDLLAAVPSVVFGLWGITVLAPFVQPFYAFLTDAFGWFPLFNGPVSGTGRTILTVALVLAVMILPIVTAISREVFLQTPTLHEEAALALGATRWEMVRTAVLPFGRPGIISASMLGLGRALGETMAVAIVLSPSFVVNFALLQSTNSNTVAANIALSFPEAYGLKVNELVASGLMLFVITLLVNMLARYIINRRKAFSGAN